MTQNIHGAHLVATLLAAVIYSRQIVNCVLYYSITEISSSRDSSCCIYILPIVERRRLVSERPSFVMHLFKRPACRETQASRITNIILRHHHRRSAILRTCSRMNLLLVRRVALVRDVFVNFAKQMCKICQRYIVYFCHI